MIYIRVLWRQNDDNYPIEIYSELNVNRNEVRKIEFFTNNKIGYASERFSHEETILSECSLPSLNEINSDLQFSAVEITKKKFFTLWNKYTPPNS